MNISTRDSLLAAVLYADVFDAPLRWDEVSLWRVGRRGAATSLPSPLKRIQSTGASFVVMPRRAALISIRRRREAGARVKWAIAQKAAHLLRFIPTIQLVGVTGGLALNNASARDDIDFFCVTSRGTLWTSRLAATLLLDILGMRRKPNQRNVANRICLNMFMEEGSFTLASHERDLFAAHEVLHMVPLWKKGSVYLRFLEANPWVRAFLPNAWDRAVRAAKQKRTKHTNNVAESFTQGNFRLLEPAARSFGLWYMHDKRTTEIVGAGVLRFHPKDARVWVLQAFRRRLALFGIPLDKIFYGR
jgi:hypothetical protein